jgi:hypothetical protein
LERFIDQVLGIKLHVPLRVCSTATSRGSHGWQRTKSVR